MNASNDMLIKWKWPRHIIQSIADNWNDWATFRSDAEFLVGEDADPYMGRQPRTMQGKSILLSGLEFN